MPLNIIGNKTEVGIHTRLCVEFITESRKCWYTYDSVNFCEVEKPVSLRVIQLLSVQAET